MSGYLVLTQTINDVDKYVGEYLPQVMPLLEKHGLEVVVADFGVQAAEGPANSAVVLRGSSVDAVGKFLEDPEYAGPKALRQSITTGANAFVLPEFTGPPE